MTALSCFDKADKATDFGRGRSCLTGPVFDKRFNGRVLRDMT